MKLTSYPEYKNSRVHWVGNVPSHWPEKRAKCYFKEIDERSKTGAEEMLSVSHITGVTPRSQKNVTMFKAESNIGHKCCQPGDIVINTMWAWMAALGVSNHEGIVSPSYGVYRPRNLDDYNSYYLDQILRTEGYRTEYICRSTGIRSSRLRLYPDKFLSMPIICPPLDEQRLIVRFLKAQERLFNKFIRNKQRLIDLLKEQKQIVINQAVTRGLNPNVKLKPSGVEWIGDIPEHWKAAPLFRLSQVIDPHPSHRNPPLDIDGVPFLGVGDIGIDGSITNVGHRVSEEVFLEQNNRFQIENGDLAIGRVASVGKVVRLKKQKVCFSGRLAILKPLKVASAYLLHSLTATYVIGQITIETDLTTLGVLGINKLKRINIFLPPDNEQKEITEYIDRETGPIDRAISRAEREIELMNEYRTRLISDVVTGQVDVRGVEVPKAVEEELLALNKDIGDSGGAIGAEGEMGYAN